MLGCLSDISYSDKYKNTEFEYRNTISPPKIYNKSIKLDYFLLNMNGEVLAQRISRIDQL
ncbi:unnamed protein product [Paramecium pentaurelia]|uniref:Uncharacterized protein n=1 Tax=Paramecium pentaurelia TaxID=43138 RepID=A0A8S1YSD1_9CILI|nr:unnamed protein product [Paramecium pentaurelia]